MLELVSSGNEIYTHDNFLAKYDVYSFGSKFLGDPVMLTTVLSDCFGELQNHVQGGCSSSTEEANATLKRILA
jgi:hypothetical protein